MNPFRLISYTPFPPGSFPYEQTVKGVTYNFSDEGLDITGQARKIAEFRKANQLDRATVQEVVFDLDCYTCQRLGNDPRFCSNGESTQRPIVAQSRGCSSCGMKA